MISQVGQQDNSFVIEGDVVIKSPDGVVRIRLDHETGSIFGHNSKGDIVFHWEMPGNNLKLGGHTQDGDLVLFPKRATNLQDLDQATFHADSQVGSVRVGGNNTAGKIVWLDSRNNQTAFVDGEHAQLILGARNNEGDIAVQDHQGRQVFRVNGEHAHLNVGTTGNEGDITVQDYRGRQVFRVNGESAHLNVGTTDNEGDITVQDDQGRRVMHMNGATAELIVGAAGNEGDIGIVDNEGREVFRFNSENARLTLGAVGSDGDISILDRDGNTTIRLDGNTGDIVLSNGDAAEQFDIEESVDARPGTLMVLNSDGKLEPSRIPYDRKVIGVVAGAGNYRPGIVLDHKGHSKSRATISVLGKVSCQVDATYGAIEIGDLLTTSPTVGHAMKANDLQKSKGSVIGKALGSVVCGRGLINMLITLG